jgi:hypothetical protein
MVVLELRLPSLELLQHTLAVAVEQTMPLDQIVLAA